MAYFPGTGDPIRRGTRLELEPITATCSVGSTSLWLGTVEHPGQVKNMYPVSFDNKQCPPVATPEGQNLMYWLQPPVAIDGAWYVVPALASTPDSLIQSKAVELKSARVQVAGGFFVDIKEVLKPVEPGQDPGLQAATDTSSFPLSMKTVLTAADVVKRREQIQEVMLNRHKPQLVRNLLGARKEGLGIRDPETADFRKDWLRIGKDNYVVLELLVTDEDMQPITVIAVHGKVREKYPNSQVLNALGILYEVDPDLSVGDAGDIETYAPVYIGRRRLKYWAGVYYDLHDCKVIITTDQVTHEEAVEDMSPGGPGKTRLAEYLLSDIRLSTPDRVPQPYPGDKSDKELGDLLKDAKRNTAQEYQAPRVVRFPGQIPRAADFTQAQVEVVDVPRQPEPEPAEPPEAERPKPAEAPRPVEARKEEKSDAKPAKPLQPLRPAGDNPLGVVHLPGGGLDVSDAVRRFMQRKNRG